MKTELYHVKQLHYSTATFTHHLTTTSWIEATATHATLARCLKGLGYIANDVRGNNTCEEFFYTLNDSTVSLLILTEYVNSND